MNDVDKRDSSATVCNTTSQTRGTEFPINFRTCTRLVLRAIT
jgi:hypothetical protein